MGKTSPLSAEKQALLKLRLRGAAKALADKGRLSRRAGKSPAPLSYSQFYIWAADRKSPGNPSHNLPVGFRIKGDLDVGTLEDSFNAIVERHEVLRTAFTVIAGEPLQIIHAECRIKIAVVDFTHLPASESEIRLRKLASKESIEPFDLSRLPLIRVSLFKLRINDHVLIINLHHIIADGLSFVPLLDELDAFYKAFKHRGAADLPELPVQYADFACWQRRELQENPFPEQAEYWRAQMSGRLRPLALPYDRARPAVRSFNGANAHFAISRYLVEKLNALDAEGGGSFFSIALALFQILLHRYSGSQDMLILTPISIRTREELGPLIGNFLNLVPLRCDVSSDPSFTELLRRSRETTFNALSNRDLPFDRIVDGINIDRDSGRDPIFQSLLQVLPVGRARLADLEIENFQIDYAFSQFDLSLHLYEEVEGYRGRFEYSTDIFYADTVEELASAFMRLLETVVADPDRPIATLPLPHVIDRKPLPAAERSSEQTAYVAPQSLLEKQIAKVWGEMLHIEQVGVRENFFDLGGHSLLLVKTCNRLSTELHRELKIVDLFTYPTVEALARHLGREAGADGIERDAITRAIRRDTGSGQVEPIAIIAMSGRFPGAGDIESFWANLREGKESITFFSADEMRESGVPENVISNPNYVGAMGYLEDADKFDAAFFGYSAREAESIDPQERLLLECAAETLERAGYDPDRYHGLIGVYAGSMGNTYLSGMRTQHVPLGSNGWLSTALASAGDFLTTRISYKLNLHGPSVNVQTACSTSLVAVHQACRALWNYECDMALAGGVSVVLPMKSGAIYMEEGIYSPDGHCRVFDAGANGIVGGNGVALVLLKRLSAALADGDHIHSVIRGTAINNDGSSKAGYTAPSVEGQAQVIALAQASGVCDPDSIGYVEAHGTGTLLGDPIEVAALTRVFGDGRRRSSTCWIGSVKTNFGHLYAAAGVAGLIKTVLSLEHKELVPSLNFSKPNPQIEFTAGPFKVNTELRRWESPEGVPRRAGVSSFGFGGTNVHAVLEESPVLESTGPSREWQLLCLSTKTDSALEQAITNLARHLSKHPDINLADVAYTLQLGRREFPHRCAVVCRDVADAVSALNGGAAQRLIRSVHKGGVRSVHFMFTGQGAQYPNMGLGLYNTEALFREAVDNGCEKLKSRVGLNLREVLFPAEDAFQQAAEQLTRTDMAQPALFLIEYALARLWMSLGIQPAAMIGHSIGEYVAACLAGVMSLDDALELVAKRGRLMGQLPPGSMLAVPLSEAQVLPLLSEQLSLASINSSSLCVVSGPQTHIAALEAQLVAMGLSPRRLHTSHAFHSSMMDPILEPFTSLVRGIVLNPPRLPYISNVTGQWITPEQATDSAYYAAHLRQPVQFARGLEQLFSDSIGVFLEVGPGHTLANLARRHPAHKEKQTFIASMRNAGETQADETVFTESMGRLWLAGARPEWLALHSGVPRRRVRLPTYPYQRQRYWLESGKEGGHPTVSTTLARKSEIGDWLYAPSWKRAPSPADFKGSATGPLRWLLFADECGWAEKLARRLTGDGDVVVMVHPGRVFEELDDFTYSIDPGKDDHYDSLFAALDDKKELPTRIVHLWAVTGLLNGHAHVPIEATLDRCFWSPTCVAKALGRVASGERFEVTFVSEGVQEVTGDESLRPEKAMVIGPCRVIPQEYPGIDCRSVDVALPQPGSQGERLLLNQLCAELHSPPVDAFVAYRGRHRWVRTFEPVRLPPFEGRPLRLRDNGVYLITGGLGGIGLAIAEYLAASVSARLVLISRTGLPERKNWDSWLETHAPDDKTSNQIRRIVAIEKSGAEVMVASADVGNRDQMERIAKSARERFGEIHGVVHSAGVPAGGIIELKTLQSATTILAPKVQGTMVLNDIFADAELDFVVLCSSLSAVLGGAGQVDYTAANAYLDTVALAQTRNDRRLTVSIAWDSWSETGMAVETAATSNLSELRRKDLEAGIRDAEGIEVFRRVLESSLPHVLISTRELQGRIDQGSSREKLVGEEPQAAGDSATSQAYPRPAISSQYEAPRNDVERLLADIWGKMLGINQVGIHDNFFELGGDSVIGIQITARANQAGLRFTPKQAFENQTIATLAAVAGAKEAIAPDPGIVECQDVDAGDEAFASLNGFGVSDSDLAEIGRQLEAQAQEE